MENHMPLDLVIKILCLLPVKSLVRFTCVCKQWGLTMKDKSFIKLQLQESIETNNLVCYNHGSRRLLPMDLNSMLTREEDFFDADKELIPPYQVIQFIGICNGLICYTTYDDYNLNWDKRIVLWNMSTREHLILPAHPNVPSGSGLIGIGFGYDSINDDHKVIKIFDTQNFHYSSFYSLRSKSWGNISRWNSYNTFGFNKGDYASGAVHWLASDEQFHFLLAYNINTETQHVLQLPFKIINDYHRLNTTVQCIGLVDDFYLCHKSNCPPFLEMWVMKEYGVKESWTRLFRIDTNEVGLGRSCCCPFTCCFNNGDEEVLLVADDYLFCYNLWDKTFKSVRIARPYIHALIYHPSLVRILE